MVDRIRLACALLCALFAAGCGTEPAAQTPSADADTLAYESARAEVMPDEAERRWEEIEFLPSYAAGLKAASDEQKPLMLWVMNGHPLGCT